MFVGFFSDFANFWQKYKSLPEGMWNKHTYMYSLQRTAYHMSFYMFVLYRVKLVTILGRYWKGFKNLLIFEINTTKTAGLS